LIQFLNGLVTGLNNLYPTHPAYIQRLPEGFQRPSFLIEFISGSAEELTRDTIRQDVVFEIKYYGTLDANGVVDRVKQMEEVSNLQKWFFIGYLDVDTDRKAKIAKISVKPFNEEVSISLEMNLIENRRTADVYEVMQQVDVSMNYNQ
jgi:molybdopterin/thiamine biosynthesis adenylyltransferase